MHIYCPMKTALKRIGYVTGLRASFGTLDNNLCNPPLNLPPCFQQWITFDPLSFLTACCLWFLLLFLYSNLNLDSVTQVIIHAKAFLIRRILNCSNSLAVELLPRVANVSHLSKKQIKIEQLRQFRFFYGKDLCAGISKRRSLKWQCELKIFLFYLYMLPEWITKVIRAG